MAVVTNVYPIPLLCALIHPISCTITSCSAIVWHSCPSHKHAVIGTVLLIILGLVTAACKSRGASLGRGNWQPRSHDLGSGILDAIQ